MLIGKMKAKKAAKEEAKEDEDEKPPVVAAGDDEEEGEGKEKPASKPSRFGGMLGLILAVVAITVVGGGAGAGLGMQIAGKIAKTVAEREAAAHQPVDDPKAVPQVSGDMMIQEIEPVITNLASPSDTWIRLETAMVFKNGAIENPQVTAAELRQDMVAYARTITLAQLEGPSALQHLREDLNERASLRTDGHIDELIIQTLVIQ